MFIAISARVFCENSTFRHQSRSKQALPRGRYRRRTGGAFDRLKTP